MSMRHMAKARGGAIAVAAALTLALAGCGGGGSAKDDAKPSNVQSHKAGSQTPAANPTQSDTPAPIIATLKGPAELTLTINSASRDQGGFLTVSGQIRNGGTEAFVETAAWRGDEKSASAASVAGATLTDKPGKKRYYGLRDTDGRCLCTVGITRIGPGESMPFFVQFPSPPASTTDVDFNLPTFATATVKISG
ncbi:hypothetical protein GCM10010347_14930 [Streptomyces cirratus]|uniref:Secreted protein n=1 Tax=Streptomyces cirratus TaxID=68187 RepID=A0ABQ3EQZ9_9ACTN|nr:hypothetical protein [Streptomyces cirratus]GHB46330.1 hypothetical protein GCM10010347_14930 [Streptomyces cirratus]